MFRDFQSVGRFESVDITEKLIKEFYMQKKIIALAIASALTLPAVAMADMGGNVGLYGQVNVSADRVNHGQATNSTNSNELSNNDSRLGVAGNEDIGGGLTGMFQAEGTVDIAAGAFSMDRNTFLGLKSADFGTGLAGNYDSAYKSSTRELDLFADTVAADNRGNVTNAPTMMGVGHDVRRTNSLNYMSPSMSGFSVNAGVAKAQTATNGASVSLAGMYGMEGMYATLAYDKTKAPTAADAATKAIKLGGSYAIDAFKLNAIVEKTTSTVTAGDTTGTNLYLGGQYSLSTTDAVKLAYAKRGDTTALGVKNVDNAKQVSVGYDHGMSKRTSVYGLFTKVTAAGVAADPSTVSVGMKHAF
jgi:predicted porin